MASVVSRAVYIQGAELIAIGEEVQVLLTHRGVGRVQAGGVFAS